MVEVGLVPRAQEMAGVGDDCCCRFGVAMETVSAEKNGHDEAMAIAAADVGCIPTH